MPSTSEEPEIYVCTACRNEFETWSGKCPECHAFSSLVKESELPDDEEEGEEEDEDDDDSDEEAPEARPLDEVDTEDAARVPTGISELDRVLGGGAVLGGVTLVGGDPGVGKSTLLLQALASLSDQGAISLYVTGEESASQVAARGRRIENVVPKKLLILSDQRTEVILEEIERVSPHVMVIDSVQTIHTKDGQAGTITQLREVTHQIIRIAKRKRIATFLVGHVTKDGGLAGPKLLEHLVDTVLAFEGEKGQAFRTLRTQKNRYGSATETGIFEMTSEGMQEVPNASEFFLAERNLDASGSIIAATCEGNRSMLVEVQSLVSTVKVTGGRVTSNGVDASRLSMILAILEQKLVGKTELFLAGRDIFVNVAGGLSISEPAMDLPIALAIASALVQVPLHPHLVAFGEVGLTGEIRGVPRVPARLSEAGTMGFQIALLPQSVAGGKKQKSPLRLQPVRHLGQALDLILPAGKTKERKRA